MPIRPNRMALLLGALLAAVIAGVQPASARGPTLPEIRLPPGQAVPACVTPSRMMRHILERTPNLNPAFRDIARYYKQHGEALRIRWDYAFYQMLLETNYLSYKTGSGGWGDVDPKQNNFAGIGTTGGGVPGDSFPDVSSGVLAQMQHLTAYSGERVARPLAPRTREAGRHHRAVAGAEAAGAVLRPHQPLGRRPQLCHLHRVRRRALSPRQLHGHGRAAAALRRGSRSAALPPC